MTGNWLSQHEIYAQTVEGVLLLVFLAVFSFLLRDQSLDTFFTRLCKVWMLIGLSIKLIFTIATIVLIATTGKEGSLIDNNTFVKNHYNLYIDGFLIAPILLMILPVHAIG